MQVSTDGIVKFIGKQSFFGRDENKTQYYVAQVLDETGKILRLFCSEETYTLLSACNFGQDLSVTLDVYESNNGLRVKVKDLVI